MFLVHRTGGGKYICAIHLHNNMLRQLQQRLCRGYALRRSFQGIIRGHYSYVIGRFRCNPLKLLKFAFVVKHNRNENDYHLHPQQNIHPTFKLSFSSHSKAPTRRCYPLPYTTLPWPLSMALMGLYVPPSHCPQNRLISSPIESCYRLSCSIVRHGDIAAYNVCYVKCYLNRVTGNAYRNDRQN